MCWCGNIISHYNDICAGMYDGIKDDYTLKKNI